MEVIEKIRWKGDKTVVVERVRKRAKRGMKEKKENEERKGLKDQKRHQMEER